MFIGARDMFSCMCTRRSLKSEKQMIILDFKTYFLIVDELNFGFEIDLSSLA